MPCPTDELEKAALVDEVVFFALLEERLSADAQNFSGAANFVAGGFESCFDGVALEIFE
jgi:hypothetical protein